MKMEDGEGKSVEDNIDSKVRELQGKLPFGRIEQLLKSYIRAVAKGTEDLLDEYNDVGPIKLYYKKLLSELDGEDDKNMDVLDGITLDDSPDDLVMTILKNVTDSVDLGSNAQNFTMRVTDIYTGNRKEGDIDDAIETAKDLGLEDT